MAGKLLTAIKGAFTKQSPPIILGNEPSFKVKPKLRLSTRNYDGRTGGGNYFEAAGRSDWRRGWTTSDHQTINSLLYTNLEIIRGRARYAYNNDELMRGYILKAVQNIVGEKGFTCLPDAMMGDGETYNVKLNHTHKLTLKEQSNKENFTVSGNMSRTEVEKLLVLEILRDGEALVQRIRGYGKNGTGYTLRLIDPALLFTEYVMNKENGNRVICGIEVDDDYRPVAYWFRRQENRSSYASLWTYKSGDAVRVEATDICHIFMKWYPNQLRGYSWATPMLINLEEMRRYRDTASKAARKGAATYLTIESESGAAGYVGEPDDDDPDDEDRTPTIDMTGDNVNIMERGDRLNFADPKYPHEVYDQYMNRQTKFASTSVGISHPHLSNDWGEINYSAGQLMLHSDRDYWRGVQEWFAESFCDWWHNDWIGYMLSRGKVVRDGNIISPSKYEEMKNPRWVGKRFEPVDPEKKAAADKANLEMGLFSREELISESGRDPDLVTKKVEEGIALSKKLKKVSDPPKPAVEAKPKEEENKGEDPKKTKKPEPAKK